jgi:hypothetical protein
MRRHPRGPGVRRLMTEVKSIPSTTDASRRTDHIAFQYANGKKVTVTMHIKDDNIIAVQRTEY